MLTFDKISLSYDGNVVLKDLSFKVPQGKVFGLVGPNGAGKTSLLKAILNLIPLLSGRVLFNEENITGIPTYKIVRKGISLTFQIVKIFQQMTLLDNVLTGMPEGRGDGFFQALFNGKNLKEQERMNRENGLKLLKKVGLDSKADDWAGTLSFGQKRRLDIARLLATEPCLLLLDEPTSGLDQGAIEDVLSIVKEIRDEGRTILLVEHNIDAVRSICDEVIVLNFGEIIAHGTPEKVLDDPKVIEAYIGGN